MVNRKILYGYKIESGSITICEEERWMVEQIFQWYLEDQSYQKIADALNASHTPFSKDAPLWNKHKVKRLLENPRYTGKNGYPVLVIGNVFQAVQEKIQAKADSYAHNNVNPVNRLKPMLRCSVCNGRLLGASGQRKEEGVLRLKCERCGAAVAIGQWELMREVVWGWKNQESTEPETYAPSAEVIRLTNLVNRQLEQPEDPEQVIALIMKAAAARYDCCTIALQDRKRNRLTEVDWKHFGQAVSYITISAENDVTLYFQ